MVNKFVDSATTVIDRQAPANSRIPKEGNQISRNRIITLSRLIKNPAFNIIVSSKATPDKMVVIQGMNKINLMFLKENIRVEGIKVNRAKVIKVKYKKPLLSITRLYNNPEKILVILVINRKLNWKLPFVCIKLKSMSNLIRPFKIWSKIMYRNLLSFIIIWGRHKYTWNWEKKGS